MKANQSFCCGFCFEGSSRDELSTISYLTMKGCVVLACDFQTGYFRRRVFGEERHSCDNSHTGQRGNRGETVIAVTMWWINAEQSL